MRKALLISPAIAPLLYIVLGLFDPEATNADKGATLIVGGIFLPIASYIVTLGIGAPYYLFLTKNTTLTGLRLAAALTTGGAVVAIIVAAIIGSVLDTAGNVIIDHPSFEIYFSMFGAIPALVFSKLMGHIKFSQG